MCNVMTHLIPSLDMRSEVTHTPYLKFHYTKHVGRGKVTHYRIISFGVTNSEAYETVRIRLIGTSAHSPLKI